MAEPWTIAFGRYLRMLRERRGLSLDEVCSLSQPSVDKLSKGYLSRCEHGKHRIGFSKAIPLCRIYGIPADALMERMELDLELERTGTPETDGMSFQALLVAGNEAYTKGFKLAAYGFFRACVDRATVDPVSEPHVNRDDQLGSALFRQAGMSRSLGKVRYALHELHYLETAKLLGPRLGPLLGDRLSVCYRTLGDYPRAEQYADAAIEAAQRCNDDHALGFAYTSRGCLSDELRDPVLAAAYFEKAYEAYKKAGRPLDRASTLNSLAQCYFNQQRFQAAKQAAEAARSIAQQFEHNRPIALSQILLGEIDELHDRPQMAMRRWREALEIARRIQDHELRFKAEFVLFRHALATNELATARAIERRLRRLAPWMPPDTRELHEYRRLTLEAQSVLKTPNRVA